VILRDARELAGSEQASPGQRLVVALCLPDGSVEAANRTVASAGAERAELVVNRWTGAVTAGAVSDAKTRAGPEEEMPRAGASTRSPS
jgi:hypothetical protein